MFFCRFVWFSLFFCLALNNGKRFQQQHNFESALIRNHHKHNNHDNHHHDHSSISSISSISNNLNNNNNTLSTQYNNIITNAIVYVNNEASSGGDGTSWSTAYKSLSIALNNANEKTEFWIAQGTYTPTTDSTSTTSTFTISKNNIILYGGFKGTETSLYQRNIKLYPTILSGSIGSNSYVEHVLTITSLNSVIDGITIKEGDSVGTDDGKSTCSDCFGGGILFKNPNTGRFGPLNKRNENSNNNNDTNKNEFGNTDLKYYLNLTNVTVTQNTALLGGGLFAYADMVVTITESTFSENVALESSYHVSGGAGIYASMACELKVHRSTFTNNQAYHRGAAIYGDYGVDLLIEQTHFLNNKVTTGHGGAIYVTDRASNADSTSATIISSTFSENSAVGYGGAIFLYNGVVGLITGNTFSFNSAGLSGGALTLYEAKTGNVCNQQDNTYQSNTASNYTNCYSTGFPDLSGDLKILEFTPYLEILNTNYDVSDEPPQRPTIIYVDNSIINTGNGLSWSTALNTIQDGIKLASQYGAENTEVWVRGNTGINYVPTQVPSWTWRTDMWYNQYKSKTIDVEDNVFIFGGFQGVETERSQRDIYNNPTRISGNVYNEQNEQVSVYQVVNLHKNSRIDGFIISDGYAYYSYGTNDDLYDIPDNIDPNTINSSKDRKKLSRSIDANRSLEDIAKLIENNKNKKNGRNSYYYYSNNETLGDSSSASTQLHSYFPNRGAGVFANATSSVANCLIINNYAQIGGGLYVLYHTVTLNNVVVVNNEAVSRGGGMQIDVNGIVNCNKCYFGLNRCEGKGGAIYLDYVSKINFYGDANQGGCNFVNNTAYDGGGAVAADGSSVVTFYCDSAAFEKNSAFQDGGALYEGSYGAYANANDIKFSESTSNIYYAGNSVLNGLGVNDVFAWNYDAVIYLTPPEE